MFQIASSSQPAQPRRRREPTGLPGGHAGNHVTGFMGREGRSGVGNTEGLVRPGPDEIFPMAFLVEQDPNSTLAAHFHIVDQFQVFSAGSGYLAADPVDSICVQFVGPHTPYGPIKAGPDGISYFTLRNGYDPGARFMPASRTELPPRPRRFRQVVSQTVSKHADCAAGTEASVTEVITPEPDGLGAWYYRIPPGQSFQGPPPSGGRGQHWVVMAGELNQPGEAKLGPNSCVFLTAEEPAF